MPDTILAPAFDLDLVLERVDAYANQLLAEDGTPGYALAITDRSSTLVFRGYGFTDLAKSSVPTEETLYESGSIGKSFTAIVLSQLAAEGKVDLHAPIAGQLPLWDIPSDFEPITPHHLLTHTSGLTCGTDHVPSPEYELWLMRNTRLSLAPNQQFIYSNLGYKALGLLIEHVTGQTYAEVVRERIFEPLELTNAEGAITNNTRLRMAPGYSPRFDDRPHLPRYGWVRATWLETNTGDGCLAISAPDLASYLRALLNRGADLLSDEQFEAFTRPHTGESPEPDYGYGITRTESEESDTIGHSGGMVGYVSHMTGDLRSGFGVVTFNNAFGSPNRLAIYALECLIAAANGHALPDVPPARNLSGIENAEDYLGPWSGEATIKVVGHNNTLTIEHEGETIPLLRSAASLDAFVADHPEFHLFPLVFIRDEEGKVIELNHGPNWYANDAYQGEREFTVPEQWSGLIGHYRSYNPWSGSLRIYARKGTLIASFGSGNEASLTEHGESFLLTTPGSVDEHVNFGPFHNGLALAIRSDSGAEYVRFFTD